MAHILSRVLCIPKQNNYSAMLQLLRQQKDKKFPRGCCAVTKDLEGHWVNYTSKTYSADYQHDVRNGKLTAEANLESWSFKQGWRSSESARLPQMWTGVKGGLSLLLVVLLPRGFFSGYSGFPPPTRTKFLLDWFDQYRELARENQLRLQWLPL